MNVINELAGEFKKRDNPKIIQPQVGKVVEENPLKISIQDGKIIIKDRDILLCSLLAEKQKRKHNIKLDKKIINCRIREQNGTWKENCQIEIDPTEFTQENITEFKEILKVGDLLAMVPLGKKFLIIDKVVK